MGRPADDHLAGAAALRLPAPVREARAGTLPWVVAGKETGRGPDNEPLIAECEVVAEIDLSVIDEAMREVDRLGDDWGSLDRS